MLGVSNPPWSSNRLEMNNCSIRSNPWQRRPAAAMGSLMIRPLTRQEGERNCKAVFFLNGFAILFVATARRCYCLIATRTLKAYRICVRATADLHELFSQLSRPKPLNLKFSPQLPSFSSLASRKIRTGFKFRANPHRKVPIVFILLTGT